MSSASSLVALALWALVVLITQPTCGYEGPKKPVFSDNYYISGALSLPYAELNEPFKVWYDRRNNTSKTSYYNDLHRIYQFGPKSAPEEADREYGSVYKLAWVPASFQPDTTTGGQKERPHHGIRERLERIIPSSLLHRHEQRQSDNGKPSKTLTRMACFAIKGDVGNTIRAQTVLPDLNDFEYDSTGQCPIESPQHRDSTCELWKKVTFFGDKKNVYKFWVLRGATYDVPVYYYMLGYDTLLGSHYDRYDISYYSYTPNGALAGDFVFDSSYHKCGSMPGPGADSPMSERRAHMIVQNPIHEFIEEPHRYDHIDHEFGKFAEKHDKSYKNDSHRRTSWMNFLHNFRFISSKNRELTQYKLAVNHFADFSSKDLSYLRGRIASEGYNGGLDYEAHHKLKRSDGAAKLKDLPESWDWTLRGAVSQVKDQAVCGSCWSFGTVGSVEGANFVKTGKLHRFSQQQLIDCSWAYGNNGCDGGEDSRAYKYIMDAGGLSTEEAYGNYLGVDGKCHDKDVEKKVKISGFYNVTSGSQEALMHAIWKYGPASVSIDASRPTFTFYSHGVYFDEKCNNSPMNLDHSVLAVGYTKIDGKFVWQIKNSWSTYWGDNGYILMSSEKNNCGVMDVPTVPIIKS